MSNDKGFKIEREPKFPRGIYKFSQEMGATTQADGTSADNAPTALLAVVVRRKPDSVFPFLLPQPHKQISIELVMWYGYGKQ